MTLSGETKIARAIDDAFISPNELDSNLEAANIVDVIGNLARSIYAASQVQAKAINDLAMAIREQGKCKE